MKQITFLLVALATIGGVVAFRAPASGQTDTEAAPSYGVRIPPGYRDWRLISVAHEEGNLNSFAAVLGNDVAIRAYREGKLPFPDGAIIAALHYGHVPSEENNKVFGRPQSFVAGTPTNIQFMVKDSKKYAKTGGCPLRAYQKRDVAASLGQAPSKIPANGTSTDHENSHCISLLHLTTPSRMGKTDCRRPNSGCMTIR